MFRRGRCSENDTTIDGYNENVNTPNPKSKLKTEELKERNVMTFTG